MFKPWTTFLPETLEDYFELNTNLLGNYSRQISQTTQLHALFTTFPELSTSARCTCTPPMISSRRRCNLEYVANHLQTILRPPKLHHSLEIRIRVKIETWNTTEFAIKAWKRRRSRNLDHQTTRNFGHYSVNTTSTSSQEHTALDRTMATNESKFLTSPN